MDVIIYSDEGEKIKKNTKASRVPEIGQQKSPHRQVPKYKAKDRQIEITDHYKK